MRSKTSLGTILTIIGIAGLIYAVIDLFNDYATRSLLSGIILLGVFSFFAGVTLLRDATNQA